jgi:hypothetical protein
VNREDRPGSRALGPGHVHAAGGRFSAALVHGGALPMLSVEAYWHSLRCQPPRQWLHRARYWLAWRFYPRLPAMVSGWCRFAARQTRPRTGFSWPGSAPPGDCHAAANRFCFLNEPVDFGGRIDWNPAGRSLLWRFHLHSFDWAPGADPALLARQIESWIGANPPGSWPGWHPYPASLRIVNWIRAFARCGAPSPQAQDSLALQAAFLERNLEFHLGGNHLLENIRALLAAGLYFEGAAATRWKETALCLLRQELAKQILPDGGHIERAPYYHYRMTALVSDLVSLLQAQRLAVPPELSMAAAGMARFSRALRHLDGSLPGFHDAVAPVISAPAPAGSPVSFPASGYYILDNRHGRLIADFGAPGGSPNPAHQHAGIFSFEVSAGPRLVVVDSGTSTYQPGPERCRLRSTAAHNTVRVDRQDQFQVWASFRAGRRAWVRNVAERREEDFQCISAVHDGYRRSGVAHRRTILSLPEAGWLIVDDVTGRGSHLLESFLHLAPGIAPQVHEDRVCLSPSGWAVLPFGAPTPEIVPSSYSPAVGRTEPSKALVLRVETELPCRFGYFLGVPQHLQWDGRGRFQIATATRRFAVEIAEVPSGPAVSRALLEAELCSVCSS